jgi:hypothetical protein
MKQFLYACTEEFGHPFHIITDSDFLRKRRNRGTESSNVPSEGKCRVCCSLFIKNESVDLCSPNNVLLISKALRRRKEL